MRFTIQTALIGTMLTAAACSQADLRNYAAKRAFEDNNRPLVGFTIEAVPAAPDYDRDSTWAHLPEDPQAHPIDVFYVAPTAWYGDDNWNMPLGDTKTKTYLQTILWRQASVFDHATNIYAPYYRQAQVYAFLDKSGDGAKALEIAYEDVERAFLYYLANFNQGRPFILAGHNQGTHHLKRLIKTRFYRPELQERFVAGYLLGMPVTQLDLEDPDFVMCRDAQQTGCVVSWNTDPSRLYSSTESDALAVNPLTWDAGTDSEYAPPQLNKGAVFFAYLEPPQDPDYRKHPGMMSSAKAGATVIPHYTGARIVRGALIIDAPPNPQTRKIYLGPGNYHAYDYSFFFLDIQENVKTRIDQYLKTHPARQLTSFNQSTCRCQADPGY